MPEQQTDFIFCTVGEEWGFLGTTLIVALFGALILRCIQVGERQRSRFTRIYAYCVASIFFLHLMINVGWPSVCARDRHSASSQLRR